MNKTILIVGLVAVGALFLFRKQVQGFFVKSANALSNSIGAPKNTTDANKSEIVLDVSPTLRADVFAKDSDFLFAPNVIDQLNTGFVTNFGGILTTRYAQYGEIKLTAQTLGRVGTVENKITVQNVSNDKVQFAVYSETIDSNGFTEDIDSQQVELAPKGVKSIDFVQQVSKGAKTVNSLAWTSLVNPIPVCEQVVTKVTVN